MSYSVFITSTFQKEFKSLSKKYLSAKSDLAELIDAIKMSPRFGVPLGKDCYKVRMAISSKGKGKSGGVRVITCVKIVQNTVFMLSVYDKSDKETVDDNELSILLEAAGLL